MGTRRVRNRRNKRTRKHLRKVGRKSRHQKRRRSRVNRTRRRGGHPDNDGSDNENFYDEQNFNRLRWKKRSQYNETQEAKKANETKDRLMRTAAERVNKLAEKFLARRVRMSMLSDKSKPSNKIANLDDDTLSLIFDNLSMADIKNLIRTNQTLHDTANNRQHKEMFARKADEEAKKRAQEHKEQAEKQAEKQAKEDEQTFIDRYGSGMRLAR